MNMGSKSKKVKHTKFFPSQKALKSEEWHCAPSILENYQHNYSLSLENRDFLSLDFNAARKMVHISLSLASEGGREYVATIKDGNILQERERISRLPVDLSWRLDPFIKFFGQIPDLSPLRAIGGNFGIPKLLSKDNPYNLRIYELYLPRSPWRLLKKYLEKRRAQEALACSRLQKLWRRLPQEAFDLGLGTIMIYILGFKGYLGFAELACLSGFYGIFSGAFDWLWRQRSPFIPKVAFFVCISVLLVYWQVQYRMWAIYL